VAVITDFLSPLRRIFSPFAKSKGIDLDRVARKVEDVIGAQPGTVPHILLRAAVEGFLL